MLLLVIEGATVHLRGTMSGTVDCTTLTGKVDETDLLLTVGMRTLGHFWLDRCLCGQRVHFFQMYFKP